MRGLHGLHPSAHSHFCHPQTAGAKNHYRRQDGEKCFHVLRLFFDVARAFKKIKVVVH